MKKPPTIIIDTREKNPFIFSSQKGIIEFKPLKTGDYSIKGMSSSDHHHSIVIERKSLTDLFGSCGNNRKRFEKEIQRMSKFDYAEIVIESDLRACFHVPPPLSMMKPYSVYMTMLSWSQKYNVHVSWCTDRVFAEKHTFLTLTRFWKDRLVGGKCEFWNI